MSFPVDGTSINQTHVFNSPSHFETTRKDLCRQLVQSHNHNPRKEWALAHTKVVKSMEQFYQDLKVQSACKDTFKSN